jgi:hypothetical protein
MLSTVEAAIKLGVGVELIEYFIGHCPKHKEDRKLPAKKMDGQILIDEKDLLHFQRYLNLPWPVPPSGDRPGIPKAIREDIKHESHLGCAICGHMDNGEIAHIDAVETSLNNSPDNLIYLCPNHHTKYDLGYKPANNVSEETVRAAKLLKRKSRQRMLAYEANAVKGMLGLIQLIKAIGAKLKAKENQDQVEILTTEVQKLLELVPELSDVAQEQAKKDQPAKEIEKVLAEHAPTFAKLAANAKTAKSSGEVKSVVDAVTDKSHELLLDFDEVDCPHCGGHGMTGLVGDFCAYCKGSCLVTQEEAAKYDPDEIDEVECPHCHGNGTIGLTQIFCKFCGGSCVVSKEEAEEYDASEIDETNCPHCNGRGTIGFNRNFCAYCNGDCVVSKEEAEEYDPDEIDEVECPHCNGHGWRGFTQSICDYCKGDSVVTKEEADTYNPDEMDEEDCPHCNGRGRIGGNDMICEYCGGDGFVTAQEVKDYDSDKIDEVECPKCHGRGTYGLVDDPCKLCKGDTVVTKKVRAAYINKHGEE